VSGSAKWDPMDGDNVVASDTVFVTGGAFGDVNMSDCRIQRIQEACLMRFRGAPMEALRRGKPN
jgi:hypothetical protein